MKWTEQIFQEFIDALQTADDNEGFRRIATRAANGLGFRWFAYLRIDDDASRLISSYPISWTDRYFRRGYQRLDPVVLRARAVHSVFSWGADGSILAKSRAERTFFEEAATFGVKSGITVPIRGGFGRIAAFTLASDDPTMKPQRLLQTSGDMMQLVGLYFHTYLAGQLAAKASPVPNENPLSQRERQCLAWTARGKTASETAILTGITARTVAFHLENARRKLGAVSIAHCVAQAFRGGLLP